eukprot:193656-Pyramimonas_sp.AAC.1
MPAAGRRTRRVVGGAGTGAAAEVLDPRPRGDGSSRGGRGGARPRPLRVDAGTVLGGRRPLARGSDAGRPAVERPAARPRRVRSAACGAAVAPRMEGADAVAEASFSRDAREKPQLNLFRAMGQKGYRAVGL